MAEGVARDSPGDADRSLTQSILLLRLLRRVQPRRRNRSEAAPGIPTNYTVGDSCSKFCTAAFLIINFVELLASLGLLGFTGDKLRNFQLGLHQDERGTNLQTGVASADVFCKKTMRIMNRTLLVRARRSIVGLISKKGSGGCIIRTVPTASVMLCPGSGGPRGESNKFYCFQKIETFISGGMFISPLASVQSNKTEKTRLALYPGLSYTIHRNT